ncbi:MAG: NAD(P)H-hydrate dehydratase [Verrucomicrobia subdivision 3 bacterium]|nr:NAD(P)H-hydrate dehydratase [Limisphaerales bacterium]
MPFPVISVAQMREWEKVTWASGQTEQAVMRRAGDAVARTAERMTKVGDRILVLAGKGHNGEDARFAAASIKERTAQLVPVFDPDLVIREFSPLLSPAPALIIDGLFGIGLNRPLARPWTHLIEKLNETKVPLLAVDVPSGLNADTGEPLEVAIRATITLTLGAVKQGFLKPSAWPFVGKLEVAPDIGLVPYPFETEISLIDAADFDGFPPPRPVAGHKGTFGHLAIIAGSVGYHGAAVLAARGAQRAQPGLITLYTTEGAYVPVARQLQSVMVKPWQPPLRLPESCTALMIGPGLAAEDLAPTMRDAAHDLWKNSELAVIVDASALAWLPEGPSKSAMRVITPHPGEAARMLGVNTSELQADRPAALRQLSRRFGDCYVALKGHQTLMGRSTGDLFVNSSGNPHLAQGGSGDLLAGYLGGLFAQPELQKEPARTLRYAVWQHGAAADSLLARKPNWTVEELADVLGSVR